MVQFNKKKDYDVADLVNIMDILRGDNGCPWDMEQTHKSIRKNFIEEVYEACEAIDNDDCGNLLEELGDVLLQVIFHSKISQEAGGFGFNAVADGICKKLIHRHPHIFGDVVAENSDQVLDNWEKIKIAEKGSTTHTQEMERVAKSLPALMYAEKIQRKAQKAGFDWPVVEPMLAKVLEELGEVTEAIADNSNIHEEIGDLLFSVVNVARFTGVDPEQALFDASQKFKNRFAYIENAVGERIHTMSLEEMDVLWAQYKKEN